jgi:hypothetical protein
MKQLRFLLFGLFVMFASGMSGKDITFLPSEFTATQSGDYSLTKDGVTMTVTASTVTDSQFRIFNGQTITFTSTGEKLIKIVLTCMSNGTAKYGPGNFGAIDGYTFEAEGKLGTWTGNASTLTLTAKGAQVRATQIVVTVGIKTLDDFIECVNLDAPMGKSVYAKAKNLVERANAAKVLGDEDIINQVFTQILEAYDEISNSIVLFSRLLEAIENETTGLNAVISNSTNNDAKDEATALANTILSDIENHIIEDSEVEELQDQIDAMKDRLNNLCDGIYYNFITNAKLAEVVGNPNNKYNGSIIIPETVEFEGITYSVVSVKEGAFYDCSDLTSVSIPNSVTSIGSSAFYGCSGLIEVLSMIQDPFVINTNCWPNDNIVLYIPKGTKGLYEATDGWSMFKNIIEKDNGFFVDNAVYLNDTLARQGSKMTLSLKMKNTVPIRGFQFDLYLPEGLTVAKNSKGKILGALSADRLPEEDGHTLSLSEQTDGAIRFLCNSQYDETFTGNDGEIATLQVNIGQDVEEGDYFIQLKDVKLTETNISRYYETKLLKSRLTVEPCLLGDINSDGTVDVSDYTGVANHIHGNTPAGFFLKAGDVDESGRIDISDYTGIANIIHTGSIYGISGSRATSRGPKKENTDVSSNDNVIYVEPFTVEPGTQTAISFKMKNTAEIRGFQFDLYLPEGVTVVKNSKGRIQGTLSAGRLPEDDEHDLTFSEQADGAIRFLCSSQYDETFTGNDGEIVTLQVTVAENIADGNYPVLLKRVKLTETDISKFYVTEEVETTMSVLTTAEIKKGDVNGDGYLTADDVTALVNYILGLGTLVNEAAAYVNDDEKIDIADVTALIGIVTEP